MIYKILHPVGLVGLGIQFSSLIFGDVYVYVYKYEVYIFAPEKGILQTQTMGGEFVHFVPQEDKWLAHYWPNMQSCMYESILGK